MTVDEPNGPVLIVLSGEIVSHADIVESILSRFSHIEYQHQLLERIDRGAVKLPENTFELIYIASYPESHKIDLDNKILDLFHKSLKSSGKLDGSINFSNTLPALLSGFIVSNNGNYWIKPDLCSKTTSTALNRQKIKTCTSNVLPKFKKLSIKQDQDDSDDDIIDENDLINDISPIDVSTIVLPAQCRPPNGKRRRKACKDCTCGLKELEEQELDQQRNKQQKVILSSDDITEVDFTIPGKPVGSCGSCALGDAFRCDGCPYLGLPPFKPGEIVTVSGFAGDDL